MSAGQNLSLMTIDAFESLPEPKVEMPYSLVEGYDARAADVGVILTETLKKALAAGYLNVPPQLVVFIKSRSNRDVQIEKDAIECLTHVQRPLGMFSVIPMWSMSTRRLARRNTSRGRAFLCHLRWVAASE